MFLSSFAVYGFSELGKSDVVTEETALETASMVVTSTNQEVELQYSLYDHYQPSRMEVIPPGVDLSQFSLENPGDNEEVSAG